MNKVVSISLVIMVAATVTSAFTCLPLEARRDIGLGSHSLVPRHYSIDTPFDDGNGRERTKEPNYHSVPSKVEKNIQRFAMGDDLHLLRKQVLGLRSELITARKLRRKSRVKELENAIIEAQQMDAEFVYSVEMNRLRTAQLHGKTGEAENILEKALEARSALPQFNMEGLWVGKNKHGYEMINITYEGDLLRAYKITGDKNIPSGEVSFEVDLSPDLGAEWFLEPIELGDCAAEQHGAKYLPRFVGDAQVAEEGFRNPRVVEGQLILVNEYFSFALLPLDTHVFFGRPSEELTLKLLREAEDAKPEIEKKRDVLQRMYDNSEDVEEFTHTVAGGCWE